MEHVVTTLSVSRASPCFEKHVRDSSKALLLDIEEKALNLRLVIAELFAVNISLLWEVLIFWN